MLNRSPALDNLLALPHRRRLSRPSATFTFPDLLRDVPNALIARRVGARTAGTVGSWKKGRCPQARFHDGLRDLESVVLRAMDA